MSSDFKNCTKCNQSKLLAEFRKDKKAKNGLTSACKSCLNQKAKEAYKKNPEHKLAKNRAWTAKNLDKHRELNRNWASQNKKRASEISKNWYQANRDKKLEQNKLWAKANPEARRAIWLKRRSQKKLATFGAVTWKDIDKMLSQPCLYCGALAQEIDHIIPLSKGGNHSIGNLAPSCLSCNRSKGAKTVTEWKAKING